MSDETTESTTSKEVSRSRQKRVVMWLKEKFKFCLFTIIGFAPMVVFLDFGMDILLFEDYGEIKGMMFVVCVVFYSEFCKKYRDT